MENKIPEKDRSEDMSRREALKGGGYFTVLAFASAAALLARPDRAEAAKMSKRAAGYRNSPHSGQKCSNCRYFYPRSRKCSIVAGRFSPNGWCRLWR